MKHAYASFNKAITAEWIGIVGEVSGQPTVPVVYDHSTSGVMPTECLRVYWLEPGGPSRQPNEYKALVQLDVFINGSRRAEALDRCGKLDAALGLTGRGGYGRLDRSDWTDPEAPVKLTDMEVEPYESSWVQVPDRQSGVIHYARTLILTYKV